LKSEQQPKVLIMQDRYKSRVPSQYASLFTKEPDFTEGINTWDSESSRTKKWAAWFLDKDKILTNNISIEKKKK
jgi:hypothetical protein